MAFYTSHLFSDEELKRILKEEPGLGIETIEFGIGDSLDNADYSLFHYRERMGGWLSERPLSLHGPFLDLNPASYDTLIREATMTRFERAYACAGELHADRIIFHTGFNPSTGYETGWPAKAAEFWKRFLEGRESVQVHLENVLDLHWENVAEVLDRVNCPYFSACVDVGHANAYSLQRPEEWIRGLGERVGHIHLHDNDGKKDEHKPLGEGNIFTNVYPAEASSEEDASGKSFLELIRIHCPGASMTLEHSDAESVRKSLCFLKDFSMK